jgi:hypothetical protein
LVQLPQSDFNVAQTVGKSRAIGRHCPASNTAEQRPDESSGAAADGANDRAR